jgi:hypothetical protein
MLHPAVVGKALTEFAHGTCSALGSLQDPLTTVNENTSVVLSDQYGMFSTVTLSCARQQAWGSSRQLIVTVQCRCGQQEWRVLVCPRVQLSQ